MSCCKAIEKEAKAPNACCDTDETSKSCAKEVEVKNYYGKELKTTESLKTTACCIGKSNIPKRHREILSQIHEDVLSKFYGCGSPLPPALENTTVCDLGCGSGRDVYLASALVGPNGRVLGIDFTPEQLQVAEAYKAYHAKIFHDNVEFLAGDITKDIPERFNDKVDVIISNCVINLTLDKGNALRAAMRLLKQGGEFYFSDVFVNRRIPMHLQDDKVLWGECLSGALYLEDFRRILLNLGIADFRIVDSREMDIKKDEKESGIIAESLKDFKFYSYTIRVFRLTDLEDRQEDYGQSAIFKGGIMEDTSDIFVLDQDNVFPVGKPIRISGNTAEMLLKSRYSRFFEVSPKGEHLGLFKRQ